MLLGGGVGLRFATAQTTLTNTERTPTDRADPNSPRTLTSSSPATRRPTEPTPEEQPVREPHTPAPEGSPMRQIYPWGSPCRSPCHAMPCPHAAKLSHSHAIASSRRPAAADVLRMMTSHTHAERLATLQRIRTSQDWGRIPRCDRLALLRELRALRAQCRLQLTQQPTITMLSLQSDSQRQTEEGNR